MRAAIKISLMVIGLAAASPACRKSPPEQNIAMENGEGIPPDIEALPPDESTTTPTNDLANGDDEASNVDQPSNAD